MSLREFWIGIGVAVDFLCFEEIEKKMNFTETSKTNSSTIFGVPLRGIWLVEIENFLQTASSLSNEWNDF